MENMLYMELRAKTKYVVGLPVGKQVGLEHGKNNLRTMTTNPLVGGWGFDPGQRSSVFFKASLTDPVQPGLFYKQPLYYRERLAYISLK